MERFSSVWIVRYSESLYATYPNKGILFDGKTLFHLTNIYCPCFAKHHKNSLWCFLPNKEQTYLELRYAYATPYTHKATVLSTYRFVNEHIGLFPLSSSLNLTCPSQSMVQMLICMKMTGMTMLPYLTTILFIL